MPISEYLKALRSRIGTDLLLVPSVAAVIRDNRPPLSLPYPSHLFGPGVDERAFFTWDEAWLDDETNDAWSRQYAANESHSIELGKSVRCGRSHIFEVDRMTPQVHREGLVRILQNAYSGEQAAAFAYRGHWKSLRDPEEIRQVRRIEEEEWTHRREVGEMLAKLGEAPVRASEVRTWTIGRTLGGLCRVIGWFLPMYFAGRLERGNAKEYDDAAEHAAALGLETFEQALRVMADVEREHEVFFQSMVKGHRMLPVMRRLFGWG
jgi:demethoxyubiquinone hydroxylase (CLK1/Coq7/Cat5 family)